MHCGTPVPSPPPGCRRSDPLGDVTADWRFVRARLRLQGDVQELVLAAVLLRRGAWCWDISVSFYGAGVSYRISFEDWHAA